MNNLEANIIRSFAEVRKDISELKEQVQELNQKFSKKSVSKTKRRKK